MKGHGMTNLLYFSTYGEFNIPATKQYLQASGPSKYIIYKLVQNHTLLNHQIKNEIYISNTWQILLVISRKFSKFYFRIN